MILCMILLVLMRRRCSARVLDGSDACSSGCLRSCFRLTRIRKKLSRCNSHSSRCVFDAIACCTADVRSMTCILHNRSSSWLVVRSSLSVRFDKVESTVQNQDFQHLSRIDRDRLDRKRTHSHTNANSLPHDTTRIEPSKRQWMDFRAPHEKRTTRER